METVTSLAVLIRGVEYLLIFFILPVIFKAVYNLYFHPLACFPGPKLNAVTQTPRSKASVRGLLPAYAHQLHEQYGEVVRMGPNELSFISPQAWTDIYGNARGPHGFKKDQLRYVRTPNAAPNLLNADDLTHTRYRRLLSYAFSDKALREQEPIFQRYVDLLVSQLETQLTHTDVAPIDITSWFNWTTFDLIGELSVGESFGCLDNLRTHPWVSGLFKSFRIQIYIVISRQISLVRPLVDWIVGRTARRFRRRGFDYAVEKVDQRLANRDDATVHDFIHYILRAEGSEKGMTPDEIYSNANVLIVAGSETTATAMSGAIFNLCSNPRTMLKVCREIRERYANESEITFSSAMGLEYLNAVIEENLRMYPPVPGPLTRRVPRGGAIVAGYWVPDNTEVTCINFAVNHSASNFCGPELFQPERWLGDGPDGLFEQDKRHALQPFSVGPRNCIGKNLAYAEMRLILSRLLFKFDFEVRPESRYWMTDQRSYIVWEKPPLMVNLRRRSEEKGAAKEM